MVIQSDILMMGYCEANSHTPTSKISGFHRQETTSSNTCPSWQRRIVRPWTHNILSNSVIHTQKSIGQFHTAPLHVYWVIELIILWMFSRNYHKFLTGHEKKMKNESVTSTKQTIYKEILHKYNKWTFKMSCENLQRIKHRTLEKNKS